MKTDDKINFTSEVIRKVDEFTTRPTTEIWQEVSSKDNPYVASQCYCYGYELFDLVKNATYFEVLYLLMQGDLPSDEQAELLEKWFIASINLGPRHPASRAAMNAGVGKTNIAHILPISLSILGGEHLGADEVLNSITFLKEKMNQDPVEVAQMLLSNQMDSEKGDCHIAPGFGSRFSSIDLMATQTMDALSKLDGAGAAMKWGASFAAALESKNMGWLDPGVTAAVLIDLGFNNSAAMGLFQLARAPGLLAHGLEMYKRRLTDMPFLNDENYIIENE